MTPTSLEPLCVDAAGLGVMLNVSTRTVRRLDDRGAIPRAIELAGCKRWSVEEIRDWLRAGGPKREVWERRGGTS